MSLSQSVRRRAQEIRNLIHRVFHSLPIKSSSLLSASEVNHPRRFQVRRLERRLVLDAGGLPVPIFVVDPAQIPDLGPTQISFDNDGNLFIRDESTSGVDDRIVLSQAVVNNETYLVIEQQATTIADPPQGFRVPDPVYIRQDLINGNIQVQLNAGDDLLTVDLRNGNPIPQAGLVYDGGTQSLMSAPYDGLRIRGADQNMAIYRPDIQNTGDGQFLIDQRPLFFSGLEPIDIHGLSQLTIELPGSNDFIQLQNGTDFFDVNQVIDALIVSGTSDGVPFEPLAIWDVDQLTMDTTQFNGLPNDGIDTVSIVSADNAHAIRQLTVLTGMGDDLFDLSGRARFADSITLDSNAGTISQNISYIDVTLETQTATLRGALIGDFDTPIETELGSLSAEATFGIFLSEHSEITLTNIVTHRGPIIVSAEDTLVAQQVRSENNAFNDDSPDPSNSQFHADIYLTTWNPSADIIIRSVVAENGADVHLLAADDILGVIDNQASITHIVSDDLQILALNQTDDGGAVLLNTNVNDLALKVSGPFRGNVNINEADSIRLASADFQSDDLQLLTENGEIVIRAINITVSDLNPTNEGLDRTLDPELVAMGTEGRVRLFAEQSIRIENGVQINASHRSTTPLTGRVSEASATDAAVELSAGEEVFFGESVQIQTGTGDGIARFFAPRPFANVIDSSLYLFESTATDKLTSETTGFGGNLSLEVGRPGEKGLVLDIDWGAPTNRFDQISGLDGDTPLVFAHHIYTESDILNSTLNGRASATSPIEVRFSVSHHPTIRIDAPLVTQDTISETVIGNLISSTDNPRTTELLENGTAQFIVPNLAIPIRLYFPPPVLPVVEKRVLTDPPLPQIPLRNEAAEYEPTSVIESHVREEYYQIRILSLNPDEPNTGPTQRLPSDILSGNRLEQLFAQLHDGRYQIEYVLGEGNEKVLMQFEIRDGKANLIESGEVVDGLKLERLNNP